MNDDHDPVAPPGGGDCDGADIDFDLEVCAVVSDNAVPTIGGWFDGDCRDPLRGSEHHLWHADRCSPGPIPAKRVDGCGDCRTQLECARSGCWPE